MKRTIYDCWQCRHYNNDNPYGTDYCEAHDTRCSFAYDDCDQFEPDDDGIITMTKGIYEPHVEKIEETSARAE